jgi:multiple sugar transport system permease protein
LRPALEAGSSLGSRARASGKRSRVRARPIRLASLLRHGAIWTAIGLALFPIAWMASMAFKPPLEWTTAAGTITWLPKTPTLANFQYIFFGVSSAYPSSTVMEKTALHPLFASVLISSIATILATVVGSLAAYGYSRLGFGKSLPLALIQLRMFPPLAVMIPIMIMWAYLSLIDTWWGLALIYGIVTLPFGFWLMLTFLEEVPIELEEAALVEGASPWRIFYRVTLPLVKPALATTALFVFILNWSDYILALMLTRSQWITIPVFMNDLNSAQTGQLYGAKAALGLIAIVPPLILGVLIQKHLVRGLTFGALKQ